MDIFLKFKKRKQPLYLNRIYNMEKGFQNSCWKTVLPGVKESNSLAYFLKGWKSIWEQGHFQGIQDQLFYMTTFWYWSLQIIKMANMLWCVAWKHLHWLTFDCLDISDNLTKHKKENCSGSAAAITLYYKVTHGPHTNSFKMSWLSTLSGFLWLWI